MEKLANITQTDINNGVLNRMLLNAGISDVQEYVEKFHQEVEDKVVDDLEHSDLNKTDVDEQIAPAADVQNWIMGLRLRLDEPIKPPEPKPPQKQQQPPPADLKSWMQGIAPVNLHSSTDITTTQTTITVDDDDDTPVSGNVGTWLNDWSKNLAQQPPPTSLDNWLQGLVSNNINEPIGKAASSKGRLNSYLNAAQQVLSQHGYDVSNKVTPSTSVETKTGMFGNVKQMYFLVSFILFSLSNLYIFVCSI
jgi:hypothetical protein